MTFVTPVDVNLADLRHALTRELIQRAGSLGLDADRLTVSYVLNWGGFVNASFHVSDGAPRYHVKLATEDENVAKLSRWYGLAGHLSRHHCAPRVIDWLAVGDTGIAGLILEHIDGATPERLTASLSATLRPVLHALHTDALLGEQLRASHEVTSCRAVYSRTYHERFVEDLAIIRASPPPFVTPPLLEWFAREIETLAGLVTTTAAFDEPASTPMHGDLWLENLLETTDGSVFVLDWDDLTLGDPMLDVAMVLGPTRADVEPSRTDDWFVDRPARESSLERLALYSRAALLDWTLDPLADYVDASGAPEHATAVRVEKERIHRTAYAAYCRRYAV